METQTMTPVEVIVPCPSCARPMGSVGDSWQCLACHPTPVDVPICATQKCKKPLTKLGDPWNCWICLKCNKHPAVVNKMQKEEEQKKRTYLDKKLTTDDVAKMIQEALAKQAAEMTKGYPPTQADIKTMTEPETVNATSEIKQLPEDVIKPLLPETYMQKAKRLGVKTHHPDGGGMRKKVDVEADIAVKETEQVREEIEAGQTPPDENAEFARGLTAEDIME